MKKTVAYGAFRSAFRGTDDQRFVCYGIRYIVEHYLHYKWREDELDLAAAFWATHNVGFTAYPFPRDLFLKFIREKDGYFPVRLEALPEGTCAHVQVPVYQITAEEPYSALVTFLDSLLTQVWYPCTVATLSRRVRELLEDAFRTSVDKDQEESLEWKLHDLGFRGCTCVEQTIVGGTAHLLSFRGSDTMPAAFYAQFKLNGGKPVASSIGVATEHSTIMAWQSEREALTSIVRKFGDGLYALTLDTYDYRACLTDLLPTLAREQSAKAPGGHMILRPDSGDPVENVLLALGAAERVLGAATNSKGFKTLRGCSVIQTDGLTPAIIEKILHAMHHEHYAASNVTFGMGAGLLQKLDRDTLRPTSIPGFLRTPPLAHSRAFAGVWLPRPKVTRLKAASTGGPQR